MTVRRTSLASTVGNEMAELDARRERAKPELARQIKNRSRKRADGDIHGIDRESTSSRLQEAADVTEVDHGHVVKRWAPASALPAVPPLAGFHVEYVRRDNQQRGDHENLVKHQQEGWQFVRRKDYPRNVLPIQRLSDYGECIGNASSILMKLPLELKAQRDAHYNGRRDATTRAINRKGVKLDAHHEAMPIVEDVVKVTQTIHQNARGRRKAAGGEE